ncbi:MAG: hypothetical protein PHW10_02780 [Candidatus Peribacteraceae bacterium]|nr:hypothetical protein [Candidatus Peribacteraceae bacterium]
MRAARFPSAPSLLRAAWAFAGRQPVLGSLLLWLLVVPATAADGLLRTGLPQQLLRQESVGIAPLFTALFWAITLWGWAAVLLVGKRMIRNRAGRARSSFRRVAGDALPFVLPLAGTALLQACFILYRSLLYLLPSLLFLLLLSLRQPVTELPPRMLWPLLLLTPLLLPACAYALRTFFFEIVILAEGKTFRAALLGSIDKTRRRTVRILRALLVLAGMTLLPGWIASSVLHRLFARGPSLLTLAADAVGNAVTYAASVLFTLACVALYGYLHDNRGPTEVKIP